MTNRPVKKSAALKATTSLDALLDLLREELDWPIPSSMELEDAGIRVDPKEIHLDPAAAAKMQQIYRLLPPTGDEPFGVYFVEFSDGRFPIGALKRLLAKVVRKKRAPRAGAHTGRWSKDDLIFITRTGEDGGRVYLAAFETDHETKRTRIKVISWGPHDTELRLKRLVEEELPRLRWPSDGNLSTQWFAEVREVFRLGVREEIRSADRLARRMAEVAIAAREEVLGLLEVEVGSGPLRGLLAEIRNKLLSSLTERGFADMYAQTLVYGLLTARLTNPEKFATDTTAGIIDFGTPLLDVLYRYFRDPDSEFDMDELGLVELASELRSAPVEEILQNFGAVNRRDDPVVHFYEDFLEFYDPDERKRLGTYYTVLPVVRFIVSGVNEILTQHFGLTMGIADPASWKEVANRNGLKIPQGVDADSRFVNMVDPATGTGTFLLEWIRKSKDLFLSSDSGSEAGWASHFSNVILPNMTGLEISLASYAVAHLKTALEVPAAAEAVSRLPIYLTNTLLPSNTNSLQQMFSDPLTDEGILADNVKDHPGVTVIIGNPPYKDKVKGQGPAVEESIGEQKPLLDSFTPAPDRGLGTHTKILRNLYVFFWRWALHKVHGTPQEKPGIVAFITSSAWLEGPVFETMRSWVRDGNHVWVIDLGGSIKNAIPGDENVFAQITTPVAICLVSRAPHRNDAGLRYVRLRGSRASKYQWLEKASLFSDQWTEVRSDPKSTIGIEKSSEWQNFVALGELMPFHANGIHQQRTWVNDPNKKILVERWTALVNARVANRSELMKETQSKKTGGLGIDLVTREALGPINDRLNRDPVSIVRYSFRTLDRQWLLADSRVIDRPSPELWSVRSNTQVFFSELHSHPVGEGPSIVPAGHIPNLDYFHGRGGRAIPAFRDAHARKWNLLPGALELISAEIGVQITGAQLISYVAGIAGFPAFSRRFSSDLQQGGVRLPITLEHNLFLEVSKLGSQAIELFTYCERTLNNKIVSTVRIKNGPHVIGERSTARQMPEAALYDKATMQLKLGDLVIGNVRSDVWNYEVTGMLVVKKWIGYRKASPTTKWSSPLNDIVSETWPKAWTEELLDLLHVVTQLRDLEPRHERLLDRVLDGPMFSNQLLWKNELLPPPSTSTKPESQDSGIQFG